MSHIKMDEEVFLTGKENVNEETNTYAPGTTRTVLVKKTLYKDKAGNEFLVGVTRDITDRKRAEEALQGIGEAFDGHHQFPAGCHFCHRQRGKSNCLE